jgi:3'-5' exoribonuclease
LKIDEVLKEIKDEKINALVKHVVDKHYTLFTTSPAACNNHHNYPGGLLDHSHSTAMLAGKIADHFIGIGQDIKRDVVIAGAFLHDVGKVLCYKTAEKPEPGRPYDSTRESKLFHHIPIGFHMVASVAESLGYTAETYYDILHIILSHHGRLEYHSPVTPKTVEAFIVHKADFLDAYIEASPEMRGIYNKG